MKTRENAWFWACFELRKPQNEPGQAAPELRNTENEFPEDSGSPKKASHSRPNLEKRVKTRGFRNVSKKAKNNEKKQRWKTKDSRRS